MDAVMDAELSFCTKDFDLIINNKAGARQIQGQ